LKAVDTRDFQAARNLLYIINSLEGEHTINDVIDHPHLPYTLLSRAADSHNLNIVQNLLDKGANADQQAFFIAIQWRNKPMIDLLCKSNANVNVKNSTGLTSLYQALNSSDIEILDILLSYNADPNIEITITDIIDHTEGKSYAIMYALQRALLLGNNSEIMMPYYV